MAIEAFKQRMEEKIAEEIAAKPAEKLLQMGKPQLVLAPILRADTYGRIKDRITGGENAGTNPMALSQEKNIEGKRSGPEVAIPRSARNLSNAIDGILA